MSVLPTDGTTARATIGFLLSVIRSGESWSEQVEAAVDAGLDDIRALLVERDEAQRRYAELLDEKFQEGCDECDARRLEAEDALAALTRERDEARQALRDLMPFVKVPSDIEPQHVEALGRVRAAARAVLGSLTEGEQ